MTSCDGRPIRRRLNRRGAARYSVYPLHDHPARGTVIYGHWRPRACKGQGWREIQRRVYDWEHAPRVFIPLG